MSIASATGGASQKVKAFLVGFRWVSVVLGLVLTSLNSPNEFLYPHPALQIPPFVVIVVILCLEGGMTLFASTAHDAPGNRRVVVVLDILIGGVLAYAYGMGYFFLGFVLPVLEVTYFDGPFFSFVGAIFAGLISVGFSAQYIMRSMALRPTVPEALPLGTALTVAMIQQIVSGVTVTILLAWVLANVRKDGEDVDLFRRRAQDERDVLLEQIDSQRRELGEVFNLAEERQARVMELDESVAAHQAQLEETRDELEAVHKELHERKAQVQALQQMGQKKEQQMGQVHKREAEELKAEIDQLHHLLDRVTALVEVTRELHVSVHLDETLLNVLSGALNLVRSQTGILFILDETQTPGELFPEAAAGPYEKFFSNYSFKMGEGAVGWVANAMQPIKIDNESVAVGGETMASLVSYEKSAVILPLSREERAIGVLYLGRPDPGAFSEEEMDDLAEFCKHASLAIRIASEYQRAISSGIADDVTGLHNATYFNERLKEESQRSKRYRYPVTLMLMDVDRFSEFNETFGHDQGDRLLRELGDIIREHTRETDVTARLKDDKFGVLLVQSEQNDAILIADRIRMALQMRGMARAANGRSSGSFSVGIATMPKDAKDSVELFGKSDTALMDAKRNGGNSSAWPG